MIASIISLSVLLALSIYYNVELFLRCKMYREQRNRLRRSVFLTNACAVLIAVSVPTVVIAYLKKQNERNRTK